MSNKRTIKIDSQYKLDIDPYNVTLKFRSTEGKLYKSNVGKDKGKEKIGYTKNHWYYPTVKMALTKYLDLVVRDSKNIVEIIEKIEGVEKVIIDFFKKNKI